MTRRHATDARGGRWILRKSLKRQRRADSHSPAVYSEMCSESCA
jgi:hypothetical protein